VTGSGNVQFLRTTFHAGNGAPGVNGATPTSNYFAGIQTGNVASDAGTGGEQVVCGCPDKTTSSGGKGGDGETIDGPFMGFTYAPNGAAGASTPAAPAYGSFDGEGGAGEYYASGPPPSGTKCHGGEYGAPGTSAIGGAGAAAVGSIGAGGWTPAGGLTGADGNPGQGGGGGGGSVGLGVVGYGGGGGGCGGCGGAGGLPGTAGGSSFGLLVFSSNVTLSSVSLVSGAGQNGGSGSSGETGQRGGEQGSGGCPGGPGGTGSGGGGGGGGAGGNSAGVAWSGTTTLTINGTAVSGTIATAAYFAPGTAGGGGSNGGGGAAGVLGNPGLQSTSPAAPGVVAAVTQL
jgi:hypothetical protein